MKNLVFIFVLALSTSAFFTSTAKAETDTFAETTANNLNVRTMANGKSVIEQLPIGSVVAVLQTEGIWANIIYLEDNNPEKPKEGWVSAQYLRVLYTQIVRDYADNKMAGI